MHFRNALALLCAAALLAACNLNAKAPLSPADQGAIATVVEQTLRAAAVTPFASPVAPSTSAATKAGTATAASPSPTATSTKPGDKPMLNITGNSNCRTGPGASFQNVTGFTPGAKLEIIGKNTENNYWLVKLPNSTETCWVWGQYATTSGNVGSVAETTPVVPTALASVPAQPGPIFYRYECTGSSISVTLTWSDRSDNEAGFRVYRGGNQVADLPAGSSSYDDTVNQAPPQSLNYNVVAYNDNGESTPSHQTFTACP